MKEKRLTVQDLEDQIELLHHEFGQRQPEDAHRKYVGN